MPGLPTGEILERLRSGQAEPAWKAFLQKYGSVIMQVANQYEHDAASVNDCFVYVCERLSDDGFRRLLKFDVNRGVSFRAWLSSPGLLACYTCSIAFRTR